MELLVNHERGLEHSPYVRVRFILGHSFVPLQRVSHAGSERLHLETESVVLRMRYGARLTCSGASPLQSLLVGLMIRVSHYSR